MDAKEKELVVLRGTLRELQKELAEKTRLLHKKTRLEWLSRIIILVSVNFEY